MLKFAPKLILISKVPGAFYLFTLAEHSLASAPAMSDEEFCFDLLPDESAPISSFLTSDPTPNPTLKRSIPEKDATLEQIIQSVKQDQIFFFA